MKGIVLPNRSTLYYENFPYSWYVQEKSGTGPDACVACRDLGCIVSEKGEKLFVMYCIMCQETYHITCTFFEKEMNQASIIELYQKLDAAYVPLILPLSIQIKTKPLHLSTVDTKGMYPPNRSTLYDERFPISWYLKEKKGTGPDECELCLQKGCEMTSDGPVFQLYCWNCMHHQYKFTRGYNVTRNDITDLGTFYKQLDKKYIPIQEPMLLLSLRNE